MNYINTYFNDLVCLLFPITCSGCGSDLICKGQLLCADCNMQLPLTNFFKHAANPVEKVFWGRLPVIAAGSLVYFTKQSIMQQLLHQLKYRGNKEVGLYFGRLIGEELKCSKRFDQVDALIPLPLHIKKEKKRGYNQAAVICKGMAEKMDIPVIGNAVIRSSETATQTHKSRLERWNNIDGKFLITNETILVNKHVLLVDDVITTGATLEACGLALAGVEGLQLSIASLAYTSK